MKRSHWIGAALLAAGFALGQLVELPAPARAATTAVVEPGDRTFLVNLAEVVQVLELGERFKGSYETTLTLSDGSERRLRLTPMLRDGELAVELRDGAGLTYMGPDGSAYNGNLLINLRDVTDVFPLDE